MSLVADRCFCAIHHRSNQKLLEDRGFTERTGLQTARLFTFGNSVSVTDEQLFSAVRAALRGSGESSFEGLRGHKARIRVSADNIEITVVGTERAPVCIPELFVLSSNASQRIQSIKSIIDQCGPYGTGLCASLENGGAKGPYGC